MDKNKMSKMKKFYELYFYFLNTFFEVYIFIIKYFILNTIMIIKIIEKISLSFLYIFCSEIPKNFNFIFFIKIIYIIIYE